MENDDQLIELKDVPQTEKDIYKRIFVDGIDDLIVWYDLAKTIIGFQLTYDEISITYADNKFSTHFVDRCEKDNFAPTLTGTPEVYLENIMDYIENHGALVDSEIVEYVKAVLIKKVKSRASKQKPG